MEKIKKTSVDRWGSRVGTDRARFNEVLTEEPQTMQELMAKAKLSSSKYKHANRLIAQGLIEKVNQDGTTKYKLKTDAAEFSRQSQSKTPAGESATKDPAAIDAKKTMTLNLSEREMEVLEELARQKDLSKTAMIRQALRLYQMLDARLTAGDKLFFEDVRTASKAELMLL